MPRLVLEVTPDFLQAVKIAAAKRGQTMKGFMIGSVNALLEDLKDPFIAIPPGMEPLNTSRNYSPHELEIARNILKLMKSWRMGTYKEIHRELKARPEVAVVKMLQGCLNDGYLKYVDGLFHFVTAPE